MKMGLDQTAFIKDGEVVATWRKHPNLQGWMENLWHEKGGVETGENPFGSDFNCVDLQLTLEDIDQLEHDITEGLLPETGGFFFGGNSDEEYKKTDLEFCENARQALEDGEEVFYTSWW
tara:strand:- start:418 stop:774 length:357 start_codon:yes stop_codon:yes gene_type:complete